MALLVAVAVLGVSSDPSTSWWVVAAVAVISFVVTKYGNGRPVVSARTAFVAVCVLVAVTAVDTLAIAFSPLSILLLGLVFANYEPRILAAFSLLGMMIAASFLTVVSGDVAFDSSTAQGLSPLTIAGIAISATLATALLTNRGIRQLRSN